MAWVLSSSGSPSALEAKDPLWTRSQIVLHCGRYFCHSIFAACTERKALAYTCWWDRCLGHQRTRSQASPQEARPGECSLGLGCVYGFGNMDSGVAAVMWALGHRVLQVGLQTSGHAGGLRTPLRWWRKSTGEPPPGQVGSASGDSFTGYGMAQTSLLGGCGMGSRC